MNRRYFLKQTVMAMLLACTLLLTSCYSSSKLAGRSVKAVADSVWTFSLQHPDGFTMDVATMTEPTEGVVVAYAATQGCHSRKQLGKVVRHALRHDGYVGGWLDTSDSLYYFDSSRLFPEDSLAAAIRFGIENEQIAVFVLSEGREVRLDGQNTCLDPEWTFQESDFSECMHIQPTDDTIVVKLHWRLAMWELLDFSLAQFDSLVNTLCSTNDCFELTYWDFMEDVMSDIPANRRGKFLYERMNEICPNRVTAVHIKNETVNLERFATMSPGYRVLMICRKRYY